MLDIYNRLLRSPHITVPARSGNENALLTFVLGWGDAPDEGGGGMSAALCLKSSGVIKICAV